MPAKKYPLELVLLAHGPAELLNADDESLWVSDSDDDFKEEFTEDFLREEDIPDILDYLLDSKVITQQEFNAFASDRWATSVETLEGSVGDPDDDEDDDDDFDDDEDDEDDLTESEEDDAD